MANFSQTKQAYEANGRKIAEGYLSDPRHANFTLADWQKFYRELDNSDTRGMANWRNAAKVRGIARVISQHIDKLIAEQKQDIEVILCKYDVYVYLPKQGNFVLECAGLNTPQAAALVADLGERGWQTDIRLPQGI